jgi:hypothetical protein
MRPLTLPVSQTRNRQTPQSSGVKTPAQIDLPARLKPCPDGVRWLLTGTTILMFACAPLASYAQEHSAQGGQSVPPSTSTDQDKDKPASSTAGTQTPQTSPAQTSLGDVARKTRDEKKPAKPVKVFTNDNIPTSGGLSLAGATPSASDKSNGDAAANASTGADPSASSRGKQEKEWRDKFAKLRQKLETDKASVDVMQRELGTLSLQYYPDPNKAMQQQLSRDDINKKTAEIEAKKKEIAADQQAIDDAEDDLRKAGGDPGWAR